jgi:cytochrome c oxidase subunit 1
MFGRLYDERVGLLAAASVFAGFFLTFFPQFLLGNMGMPRRYYSYPERFQFLHVLSTGGAFLLGTALLTALVNLLVALRVGKPAGDNPWNSRAYEWLTRSPPPKHNFARTPVMSHGPYDYTLTEEEARARFEAR